PGAPAAGHRLGRRRPLARASVPGRDGAAPLAPRRAGPRRRRGAHGAPGADHAGRRHPQDLPARRRQPAADRLVPAAHGPGLAPERARLPPSRPDRRRPPARRPAAVGRPPLGMARRREERRRLGPLALLAAATVLALLAFMLPARDSLLRLVGEKHRHEIPSPAALLATLELLAGNRHWPLAALFWAAALGGLALL